MFTHVKEVQLPMTDLITNEDRDDIEAFISYMSAKAAALPQTHEGVPNDDRGEGAYLERTLFSGVTLVLDWGYLDTPSTYLLVRDDAPTYTGPERDLIECGELFEQLDSELADVIGLDIAEYDDVNSTDTHDVYHCFGVDPF